MDLVAWGTKATSVSLDRKCLEELYPDLTVKWHAATSSAALLLGFEVVTVIADDPQTRCGRSGV